jgi:hypothetical protein
MTEEKVYGYARDLFYGYILKGESPPNIEQLNDAYRKMTQKSFFLNMAQEEGFSSLEIAEAFGSSLSEIYKTDKALTGFPEKIKKVVLPILSGNRT